jgi:hypothetical protein
VGFGLNHFSVTYMHNGRAERPTVVAGEVIKEVFRIGTQRCSSPAVAALEDFQVVWHSCRPKGDP